ncbi:MAG TPA: hypothetical protein VF982_06720, partial [Anaerolineales bacterium]
AKRKHWTIENQLHYVRDLSFGEDRCQVHTASAPQALAALRNGILALLRDEGWPSPPTAFRHFSIDVQMLCVCLALLQLDTALIPRLLMVDTFSICTIIFIEALSLLRLPGISQLHRS